MPRQQEKAERWKPGDLHDNTIRDDLTSAILAHAKELDILPQEVITRAFWFYKASYDKAVHPKC